MLFRAIPDAKPVTPTPSAKEGVSIALTPIYGVTIPIIVRQGSLVATAAIANPRIARDKNGPVLAFTLTRSGTRSVYGRIRVTKPGVAKPVFEVRGIAVYAELGQREVILPIPDALATMLPGPAKIEYLEDNDSGGGMIASLDAFIR
jgi:hypothetical protein